MDSQIIVAPVTFGTDPEAFVSERNFITGSERIIPDEGIIAGQNGSKIIQDGVQIELNVKASPKREALAEEIAQCLGTLGRKLQGTTFDVSFDPVITMTAHDLNKLSDKARRFGCNVSYNVWGLAGPTADPRTYLVRSAGGHVHLGLSDPIFDPESGHVVGKDEEGNDQIAYHVDHRSTVAPMLDFVVGNTSVMLDRTLMAAERRKNYGKAGEYRLPKYGLEYRTLSNFWLKSYQLFGLVMGLSRLAASIVHTDLLTGSTLEQELASKLDFDKVTQAIQENDLALAHENWDVVKDFISKRGKDLGNECGLNPSNLDKFEYFLKVINEDGLSAWFPEPPMKAWARPIPTQLTWEEFLDQRVIK